MRCLAVTSFTPNWIREKLRCINRSAWNHANGIRQRIRSNLIQRHFLTPEEFGEILVFKGLAKSKNAFLRIYQPVNEIQETTGQLFNSGLDGYHFEDTDDPNRKQEILDKAISMITLLDEIKYVGIPVASAALTLTFPHLFGTVDYIVPGLLHCRRDDRGIANPLWENLENDTILEECLLMPQGNALSPNQARDLAHNDYCEYIQELWNIKKRFALSEFKISEIEVALWSYGICYIRRQKDRRSQKLPFRFQVIPNPPRGGLFAKNCPN